MKIDPTVGISFHLNLVRVQVQLGVINIANIGENFLTVVNTVSLEVYVRLTQQRRNEP